MLILRRLMSLATVVGLLAFVFATSADAEWRERYPQIALGMATTESRASLEVRFQPLMGHFEASLDVPLRIEPVADHASLIRALADGRIQLARIGGKTYAAGWIDSDGDIEPLVLPAELNGSLGYHTVLIVRADSPYRQLEDLRGRSLAWATPASISGYVMPLVGLRAAGIEPDDFFGSTGFSGGHDQSVIGVLDGTVDAAVTWTSRDERSGQLRMMMDRGMLKRGDVRVLWKSPLVPNPPFAVPSSLQEGMKRDLAAYFTTLHDLSPELANSAASGRTSGFVPATRAMYEPIVGVVRELRNGASFR